VTVPRARLKAVLIFAGLLTAIAASQWAPSNAANAAEQTGRSDRSDREEELKELTRRIEELEVQQQEALQQVTERRGVVTSFLMNTLSFGGFFETAMTGLWGPDTNGSFSYTETSLGINLGAEIGSRLKFVSQTVFALIPTTQNLNNDPRAPTIGLPAKRTFGQFIPFSVVAQGYLEFAPQPSFRIQGGMGYVPFGVAFQLREPVLFIRHSGPQMIRTLDIASPLWTGVHATGEFRGESSHWGYSAYTLTPFFNSKVTGVGDRLWWSTPREGVVAGVSSQVSKRGDDTYKAVGGDVSFNLAPFGATIEYARAFVRERDPWGVYVLPSVAILGHSLILHATLDYLDDPLNATASGPLRISDPIKKFEYGAGMNWLPTSYTRFRLAYTIMDYVGDTAAPLGVNRDFSVVDVSLAVAF
jgi:hypothetical protein